MPNNLQKMELQESVLRHVNVMVGWSPSPLYPDFRGRLTERLREAAGPENEWAWDGPLTLVWSEEHQVNIALSPTELMIVSEGPTLEIGDLSAELSSVVLDQLAVPKAEFIGSSTIWLAAASSLEDVQGWFSEQLGHFGRARLFDALGGRPTDFALKVEVAEDDFSYDVELKPVTSADAALGEDFIMEEEDAFPPASLYVEVRRSRAGEVDADDVPSRLANSLEKNIEASKRFDAIVRQDHE